MSDLIDTTEMYLRTIFELEEEGVVPLRARIAERLGHSGPTVSQTVARMERDGLLHVSGDRHLELTEGGRAKATRVMRKHRLAERLLLDVIGLEWELVHDEACRWEHVMSDHVEQKLLSMLAGPMESPYGNPIPGLEELGGPAAQPGAFREGLLSLPDAVALATVPVPAPSPAPAVAGARGGARAGGGVGTVAAAPAVPVATTAAGPAVAPVADGGLLVRRLGERLQMDVDLMRRLQGIGLVPGVRVAATLTSSGYLVTVLGGAPTDGSGAGSDVGAQVCLPADVARHVFVQAA